MRGALAMTIVGCYVACLYLAIQHPIFHYLHVLLTGIIFGVALHDLLQSLSRDADPTPGITRFFDENSLNKDAQKTQAVNKLKVIFDNKLRNAVPVLWLNSKDAREYIDGLRPDVLHLHDDTLWCIVNEGGDYAFRSPNYPNHTIVIRREFAEKALALGFLP